MAPSHRCRVDYFPLLSDSLTLLKSVHRKDFAKYCTPFIPYITSKRKLYAYNISRNNWNQKDLANLNKILVDVTKPPSNLKAFSWTDVRRRLSISLEKKANNDRRLSFRRGNIFIVRKFFTFGQRTVEPHTRHVFQITNTPLLFYKLDKSQEDLTIENRYLTDDKAYKEYILLPHQKYAIVSGTTYVIMTFQKTLFQVDVVPSTIARRFGETHQFTYEKEEKCTHWMPDTPEEEEEPEFHPSLDIPPETPHMELTNNFVPPPKRVCLSKFVIPARPSSPQPLSLSQPTFLSELNTVSEPPSSQALVRPLDSLEASPPSPRLVCPPPDYCDESSQSSVICVQVCPSPVHLNSPQTPPSIEQQPSTHKTVVCRPWESEPRIEICVNRVEIPPLPPPPTWPLNNLYVPPSWVPPSPSSTTTSIQTVLPPPSSPTYFNTLDATELINLEIQKLEASDGEWLVEFDPESLFN